MKLIINNSSTYKGGSEQVALSFIHECKEHPEHEYHVIIGQNLAKQIDTKSFPKNFSFHVLKNRPASSIYTFIKTMLWLRKLEQQVKPDCVIATGGHGYWKPKAPLVTGFNIPHYLYPESPYFKRISLRKRMYWEIRKIIDLFFFRRVDVFFVQTDDINMRVRSLMGRNNVFTVPNTISGHFYKTEKWPRKLPERKNGEIRLLTLSSYYPHKNLEIINDVVLKFLDSNLTDFRFVLTIPDQIFESKFNEGAKKYIHNIGPIPIEECPSLYEEVDFMFLPTLLECFSASYAEAMIMGKPILTSDLDFAHTVCGDAAVYFNPLDADDIAQKIIGLSLNKKKRTKLIEEGRKKARKLITPGNRTNKYLSICKKTASYG